MQWKEAATENRPNNNNKMPAALKSVFENILLEIKEVTEKGRDRESL